MKKGGVPFPYVPEESSTAGPGMSSRAAPRAAFAGARRSEVQLAVKGPPLLVTGSGPSGLRRPVPRRAAHRAFCPCQGPGQWRGASGNGARRDTGVEVAPSHLPVPRSHPARGEGPRFLSYDCGPSEAPARIPVKMLDHDGLRPVPVNLSWPIWDSVVWIHICANLLMALFGSC